MHSKGVRHRQIKTAVASKISDRNEDAVWRPRVALSLSKRAVTVPEQDHDLSGRQGVCGNRQVQSSIAVKVAETQRVYSDFCAQISINRRAKCAIAIIQKDTDEILIETEVEV